MRDTGKTLLGMKIYESDALDGIDPPAILVTEKVRLEVSAEAMPNGTLRFVARPVSPDSP